MRVLVATISLRRHTKYEVIITSTVVDVKINLLSLAGSAERFQIILVVASLATDPSPGLVNASQAFTPLPIQEGVANSQCATPVGSPWDEKNRRGASLVGCGGVIFSRPSESLRFHRSN
jgi:hypothetical protein